MRRASRMKWRRRSLRWLVLSFWVRNRNAGKVSRLGSCFMMRCSRMGSPTSAAPASRIVCIPALYRGASDGFEMPVLAVLTPAVRGQRRRPGRDHIAGQPAAVENAEVQAEEDGRGEF